VQDLARLANKVTPELKTHDRRGNRIDFVEYHPAYHELMRIAFGAEVHSFAWTHDRPGAHVARAALSYLWNQAENGTACPTGMNYSAVPVLKETSSIGDVWIPALTSAQYDPRPIPIAEKSGATMGMTLTEKQGGSDLRANTTRARALDGGGPGTLYELTGHKWFCSAPMCDGFYTIAYTDKGPTCAAFLAGWNAQPLLHSTFEGQARQSFERIIGDRVSRNAGVGDQRGGTWYQVRARDDPSDPP
jgi:putative acyl-CoA dehydrogenase